MLGSTATTQGFELTYLNSKAPMTPKAESETVTLRRELARVEVPCLEKSLALETNDTPEFRPRRFPRRAAGSAEVESTLSQQHSYSY